MDRAKRIASAVLGAALLVGGLRRRSLRGTAAALVGGWLLTGAVGGTPRLERALRSQSVVGPGSADGRDADGTTEVSRSITVGGPAADLYEVWRDVDQVSRIVGGFAEVTSRDDDRLHWTVHGPRGREVSWETRIVEAEPGEFLRWETPADATVPNEGTIRFRPAAGDRGTVVTLSVGVDPPGGALGAAALKRLDVVPESIVGEVLRRFKRLVESGEIPTVEGNPSARGRGDLL